MISVIIPALNEETQITQAVTRVLKAPFVGEVLVIDGGSTDATRIKAALAGARVICAPRGRPQQMNTGADNARFPVLYFLHADTIPPETFSLRIKEAMEEGRAFGSFRLKFDHDHWLLRLSAFLTRLPWSCVRFGDQSLFMTKAFFQELGGFDERRLILEDQELIRRARRKTPMKLFPESVVTSARRYLAHGILRTKVNFFRIYFHDVFGGTPESTVKLYLRLFPVSR